MESQQSKFKQFLASIFVVLTFMTPAAFIGVSTVTIGILSPAPVHAQITTVGDVPREIGKVVQFILDGLVIAGKVGIKSALKAFLEKIAYDTAVWLGSGDSNQKPLLFTKDVGTYLLEAGDAAGGAFLNTLADEGGFESYNLCNLNADLSLDFQLILPQFAGIEPYKPECTLSEIGQSFENLGESLYEQGAAFIENPDSMVNFQVSLGTGENALSSLLSASDQILDSQKKEERKAYVERLKSDFKDQKADISGYITTPSAVAESQLDSTIADSNEGELTQQDSIIADALNVFVSTLTSKLLERITGGILSFFTESDISDSIAGGSSTSGSGGIKAAQEKFAELKTPSFSAGGEVSILVEFASCPEQGADVVNCVIDESLRFAIEEGLTVGQAIEQGVLDEATPFAYDSTGGIITDPTLGISHRNIKILRQYSVVPVGWELAAEYNKDFDGTALTLGQLIEDFDNCSEEDYSPYCGLVDPDWPLKAPGVFCKLEGYGNNIAAEQYVDTDGSEDTPTEPFIGRLQSCLDSQSCLSEDDNGSCEAYGYCTKQERIYRFEGDSCPSYFASCEYFTDSEENEVGYLKNTINYNDCSADNEGCQWTCRVYNEVDEAFQCSGQDEIFAECDSSDPSYDASTQTCGCTVTAESCDISEGGFICETESEGSCTLGTETSDDISFDTTITFDNDVEVCESASEGCNEFIALKGGANLLANGSFEYYDNNDEDLSDSGTGLYDDLIGFDTTSDTSCSSYTNPISCNGWELVDGAAVRLTDNALYDTAAVQWDGSAGGGIVHRFDTGQPLENRSFALTFSYANPDGNTCNITGAIFADEQSSTTWPGVSSMTETETFETDASETTSYQTYTTDTYTFPDGTSETVIGVFFDTNDPSCNSVLDGVKLEENSGGSGYLDYQDAGDLVYVNTNDALACEVEEIGCDLFTPLTGESSAPIPGQITNPLSEACGEGSGFDSVECSQCEEQYIGCEAFIEQETPYNVPVKDVSGFSDYLDPSFDADLAAAVAERTGYYCEGTTTACSPDRETEDCGSGVSCLPSISLTPSTGESCSANNVGCEQYINLDQEELGGESIEYYTYIRQCVKPTAQEIADEEVDTFYTFEGSDISGYQLRSWYLKKSDIDNGPCTNLDTYGSTAETSEANCIDADQGLTADYDDCSAGEVGVDPDCTEYFDSDGNNYYRYKSNTITASDSCVALRNNADDRIYYSIPDESVSCPASADQCREFKGSQGAAVQIIVDENFDDAANIWGNGEASSETVTAGSGLSLAIGTSSINGATSAATDVAGLVNGIDSYVVSFWAKSDIDGSLIYPYFYSAESGETSYMSEDDVELTTEWRSYTVGPFVFENSTEGDEEFGFEFTDSYAYIDNVSLQKSDSYYLIQDTYESCLGFEGCEKYSDVDGNTNYLKSFTNLCSEAAVGCEALVDTNNSDDPFYAAYNDTNEYNSTNTPNDDVEVAADAVVAYAVNDSVLCNVEQAACELTGVPSLDASDNPKEYEAKYILNDPDSYGTTLCQEQQRSCEAFVDGSGEVSYFKNPGDKTCEYSSSEGKWVTADGEDCPVQNSNAEPSQPKGAICNGGVRSGELCTQDDQCPSDTTDSNTYRCVSNDSDTSGYVGLCQSSYSGCTLYTDPNMPSELSNGNFETNVDDNDSITASTPDNIPDDWMVADSADGDNAFFIYNDSGYAPSESGYAVTDVSEASRSFDLSEIISFTTYSVATDYFYSIDSDADGAGEVDGDAYNPGSPEPLLVMIPTQGDFQGLPEGIIDITTDNTDSTISIYLPNVNKSAIDSDNYYLGFYVTEDGSTYWADTDHNGFGVSSGDTTGLLSAAVAIDSANLARAGGLDGTATVTTTDATSANCDTFEQSDEQVFGGANALKLEANSTDSCMAFVADTSTATGGGAIIVDENSSYTLRGNVYLPETGSSRDFSIGLLYYDATGQIELSRSTDPEAYAFAAYEGPTRGGETVTEGEWLSFYGSIGPNEKTAFPDGTYFVRVFVETEGGDPVYFDDIEFSKNNEYTYLNSTVDGATESDQNTCIGETDIGNGCVSFRDTSDDALVYKSDIEDQLEVNSDFTVETCTYNSGEADIGCSSRENTADTNSVIRVRSDRQCAEWLSCRSSRLSLDDAGDIESQTCFQIGRCTERNEDTGVCTEWADTKNADALGTTDDYSVVTQPGDTSDLLAFSNYSGYVTVGGEWAGYCGDNVCQGGANDGDACSTDDQCESNITYGTYPTEWMPEVGSGGAASSTDLIDDGDFETVYCNGSSDFTTSPDGKVSYQQIASSRDLGAKCTQDRQCRTAEVEAKVQEILATEESDYTSDDIEYWDGWCGNFEEGVQGDFSSDGGADTAVIDYDDDISYIGTAPEGTGGVQIAAEGINLNNWLYIGPDEDAQSGITYNLGENIIQGQEYVVSFDAKYVQSPDESSDFIQVGLEHNGDSNAVDYFEVGSAMADVVFIVDASSTMAEEITEVATETSAMITGFEEAGIDFQAAIVTTGGSRQPEILDYDDYSDGQTYAYQGSDDSVGTDFTNDAATFKGAMDFIAGDLDGGQAVNYQALQETFDNSFDGGNETLNFRSGAERFIIILTDTAPESGDTYTGGGWTQTDEDNLVSEFGGADYVLYSVIQNDPDAYDGISEALGGDIWDLDDTDYTEILDAIVTGIDEEVSAFAFSETEESYSLGPITIENKEDLGATTELFIRQKGGGSGTPFLIDNLSMKPSLEIRKDGQTQTENAPESLARECRGYPGEDSVACDYTDESGAQYIGWKGYCLESDLDDPDKCVAWWPIDILSGEPDTTGRTLMTYEGKAPVYSCLVAKGNESIGACEGNGQLCQEDSQCSDGSVCLGGNDEPDDWVESGWPYDNDSDPVGDDSYSITHNYNTGLYKMTHTIDEVRVDYDSPQTGAASGDKEYAAFLKFTDLPLEQKIHISEIDSISFDIGNPIFDGGTGDNLNAAENSWGKGDGLMGPTTLNTVELELDESSDGFPMFIEESNFRDFDAGTGGVADAFDSTGAPSSDTKIGTYGFQAGIWCNNSDGTETGLCNSGSDDEDLANADIYFMRVATSSKEGEEVKKEGEIYNAGSPYNIFAEKSFVSESSSVWNTVGRIENGKYYGTGSSGTSFDGDFWRHRDSDPNLQGTCWSVNPCGANMYAVKFNFENGYLADISLIIWDGMRRFDVKKFEDVSWTFNLKESCLVLAEGADEDGNARPWRTRAVNGSSYYVPDLYYTYNLISEDSAGYGETSLFSMFGSLNDSTDPLDVDGEISASDSDADLSDFFAVQEQNVPRVYLNNSAGSVLPYACIGNCTNTVCQDGEYNDPNSEYAESCSDQDDKYIGIYGICTSDGEPVLSDEGAAIICDEETSCSTGSCTALSGLDNNGGGGDYETQLENALAVGWARYNRIFADIQGELYYVPRDTNNADRPSSVLCRAGDTTDDCVSSPTGDYSASQGDEYYENDDLEDSIDSDETYYGMDECSNGERNSDEYCGIRPTVENIEIDNNATGDIIIENGDAVTLVFDTNADADQEPINNIRIQWYGEKGDGDNDNNPSDGNADGFWGSSTSPQNDPWEAASADGHLYSNVYTCDPTSGYYDKYALGGSEDSESYDPSWGACVYEVRIQTIDAWDWCSGTEYADEVGDVRAAGSTCSSYDSYDGSIYVRY